MLFFIFQLHSDGRCTYPCLPGVLETVFCTIFLPSHWLLSYITNVKTMDCCERGMHHVAMTIINPRREYWPSQGQNNQPPILKSCTLPTKLWGPSSRLLMTLRKKPFENNVGKAENAVNQHFLLFPTLFSPHLKTNFNF